MKFNSIFVETVLTLPKNDISHSECNSALYLRDTVRSRELCKKHEIRFSSFIDNIEHKPWLELRPCYPAIIYKADEKGNTTERHSFWGFNYESKMFEFENYNKDKKKMVHDEFLLTPDQMDSGEWRFGYSAW